MLKTISLEAHVAQVIAENLTKINRDIPIDYFSWDRDNRHTVNAVESWPQKPSPTSFAKRAARKLDWMFNQRTRMAEILASFREIYAAFDQSYQLMCDQYSRNLFAELIAMKLMSEEAIRLSSFTQDFVESYETASNRILRSSEKLLVYNWVLRKVTLDSPSVTFFTAPAVLNLHYVNRLYRYRGNDVCIEVEGGDVLIDAGVGWGDTTVYLATLAKQQPGGHSYAFDILKEGMKALAKQIALNPELNNITAMLNALSDKDGEDVYISSPSPGARVVDEATDSKIKTTNIDSFVERNGIERVDFVKMDIEGSEVPALVGATRTIQTFKPKLAVSAYHKWDDLWVIPQIIHGIRNDYRYYLDCTTGFGGEAVLYCK